MRVVLFVVVVAAHVLLLLLFPAWRRYPSRESAEEASIAPIFLPPPLPEPSVSSESSSPPEVARASPGSSWQAPLIYRSASSSAISRLRSEPPSWQTAEPQVSSSGEAADVNQQQSPSIPTPAPDWRGEAELIAQADAERIVAAEDAAERRAHALTAHFKPMAPPLVRGGQEFAWSFATHRWQHLAGGGFTYALNDHCSLLIFIIPFIGCSIGKQEANGNLFQYMHKPVKFGDWDWRIEDP
jgi:hypothetical protein